MADLADVSNALVALIDATLYPNGDEAPSSTGLDAKVYAGWPQPGEIARDLGSEPPVAHVSVYPRPEEHNTTRYFLKWCELSRNTATLSASVNGNTVTIVGTVPPASAANPQNVLLIVNGVAYAYAVKPTDTTVSIAQALVTAIAANVPGTVYADSSIVLTPAARLYAARVGVVGTMEREVRRQERLFQIGIWAALPEHRDTLAAAVDGALAGTFWLNLGESPRDGHLVYRSSIQSDALERERAYRRTLLYTVEYGTLQRQTVPEIVVCQLNLEVELAGAPPPELVATLYS